MNRKSLKRLVLPAICLALAQCTSSTNVSEGPPTAFAVARIAATNGAADTSFGGGSGIVITDVDPPVLDFALAVALQDSTTSVNDNKIIAAGSDGLGGQGKIALVRYNPDGTLDKTGFGSNNTGIVLTTLASPASASAIALQPDSKILVAALTFAPATSTTSITLLRYNTDGSLDTAGFGAPNGFVNGSIGSGLPGDVCAMVRQPADGKIVVVGASQDGKLVLYRYDSTGTLDPNFGTNGTGGMTLTALGTNSSSPPDRPVAIALQSSGKIIVATRFDNKIAVLRYGTDGQLDTTTFGTSGIFTVAPSSGVVNYANAVAVQPADDKIVVVGHAFGSSNGADIALVKLSKDGAADTTFSGDGVLVNDLGFTDNAFALLLQTQISGEPKILVSGNFGNNGVSNTFVRRYNPDGTTDTTFGIQGQLTIPRFGPSNNAAGNAMALQSTGLGNFIVVAGYD